MPPDPKGNLKDRDEERSVRAAQAGDLRAFEHLFRLYRERILSDCRILTRDENNSEDLAQEVFVKAYFGLPAFEGRSSFRHWLQRIEVHHCLNHLKRREGKEVLTIDDDAVERLEQLRVPPTADREIESMEERNRIDAVLNAMPRTLRVPLILRDMQELSYEEISVSLGVGLSAVKMRIKRARERFRRLYEETPPGGLPVDWTNGRGDRL